MKEAEAEAQAQASANASGRGWPPMLVLALIVAVLIAVPWSLKLTMAQAFGEPCGGGFDCAVLDGRCVEGEHGRFCTRVCGDDSECPSSGHCGVPVHDRWQLWFSTSVVSERVCVPGPRPAQLPEVGGMPTQSNAADASSSQRPANSPRPPEQRGGFGGDKLR